MAQVAGDQWQIEFGNGEHAWRGQGEPRARFVWFELPNALSGGRIGANWRFTRLENSSWRLWNPRTGEVLEGSFFP